MAQGEEWEQPDVFPIHRNTREARSSDPAQVLVIGPSWVGDMVMAQVLFQVMRRRWPRVQIDLLAPPASAPIGERMAEIRNVHTLPIPHNSLQLRVRKEWAARLRSIDYDWSICLPGSFKSALIPFWAQIPVRTGFRGEFRKWLLNDIHRLDRKLQPRTVDRYVALGIPSGLPQPTLLPAPRLRVDQQNRGLASTRLELAPESRSIVALAPGAEYGPAKRWPVRHWIALARTLTDWNCDVWLLGGPKDASVTGEIAAAIPESRDLGGKTSLLDAVDLLSLARVAVSNDSGLMHLAGAVGCRVIALYGSSPLAMTPPLSPQARALRLELPCSPCGKRDCPLKHHHCMENMEPGTVLAAVKEFLA